MLQGQIFTNQVTDGRVLDALLSRDILLKTPFSMRIEG